MAIPVPAAYQADVAQAARVTGLPEQVVAAQIQLESDWNPDAVSPTGAQGIAQFEPQTWASWGQGSPFDPAAAFRAYARYMASLLTQEGGDVRNALAAYNAGAGNLSAGYGYADTILANARQGTTLVSTPPGTATIGGQVPGGGLVSGITSDIFGLLSVPLGIFKGVADIPSAILALAAPFIKIAEGIDWLLHPSHWIRIFAGLAGGVLVLGGIWQLTHAGSLS